jgi:hypothetical protein
MNTRLAAIRVSRRTVAIAIFKGQTLHYAEIRHLSSNSDMALASAVSYLNWALSQFHIQAAVLEEAVTSEEARAAEILGALVAEFRRQTLPYRIVSKHTVFESFAIEPLATRKELREVVATFWPQLGTRDFDPSILDAAAVGLYAQVEYLLTA